MPTCSALYVLDKISSWIAVVHGVIDHLYLQLTLWNFAGNEMKLDFLAPELRKLIEHAKDPQWNLPWCASFDIIGYDIAIFQAIKLFFGFTSSAYFENKLIINNEISLVMVMNLVTVGELRDKEGLAD